MTFTSHAARAPVPHAARVAVALLLSSGCAGRGVGRTPALPELLSVREFEVPWENAFPNDIVVDTAGRVWFTDRLTHAVGRFDPETGEFTRYPTPTPRSAPYAIVAAPDGGLWFAESVANRLARIDPATGAIREWPLAGERKGPNLLAYSNGALWFSMRDDNTIGRFDIVTGEARLVPVGTRPYGVTVARDGRVWFGVTGATALWVVDPRTMEAARPALSYGESLTNLPAGIPDSMRLRLERIARMPGDMRRVGADRGGTIWFADLTRGVTSYTPGTGEARIFHDLERTTRPYGLVVASNGLVWYGANARHEVVVLNPLTDERRRIQLPTPGGTVRHLYVDEKRRRVWVPMSDRGRIALIEFR